MNYATDTMDLLRTDVDEQMKRQVEGLWTAGDSEEFQQYGEIKDLMGRTRYLWERREDSKMEIAALEAQRQELEAQRAQGAAKRAKLRDQIRQLTEERGGLLRQLKNAQTPLPSTTRNSPETDFKSFGSVDDQVRQLRQECERLNQEREAFR